MYAWVTSLIRLRKLEALHVMPKEGIFVDSVKVEAVMKWSGPTSVTEVKSFLRLTGYYIRFIKDYSKLPATVAHLSKKR